MKHGVGSDEVGHFVIAVRLIEPEELKAAAGNDHKAVFNQQSLSVGRKFKAAAVAYVG